MENEEPKVVEKKSPAHEVIVDFLAQFARTMRQEAHTASHNPEVSASHVEFIWRAQSLVLVLARMHIPEQARSAVGAALRALPREFIPLMDLDLYAEIEGDKGGA